MNNHAKENDPLTFKAGMLLDIRQRSPTFEIGDIIPQFCSNGGYRHYIMPSFARAVQAPEPSGSDGFDIKTAVEKNRRKKNLSQPKKTLAPQGFFAYIEFV